MSPQQNSTRQRLIQAALQLFAAQGITETTTRQIADLAEVNEVTLFRKFGNKHNLLLATIEDAEVFNRLGESLGQQANHLDNVPEALREYAATCLQLLDQSPEFVRSLIGEAGKYPPESRQAIGRGIYQVNQGTAQYFATVFNRPGLKGEDDAVRISPTTLASLLNVLLLGYAVLELTSEAADLWRDRDEFLHDLVELLLWGMALPTPESSDSPQHRSPGVGRVELTERSAPSEVIADLPATLVHQILRRARKLGLQEYALVYVLFASGLNPAEIVGLQRSHLISDGQQNLLQVNRGTIQQVPLNQWILGKRYGSRNQHPLLQWLKSRKDDQSALFLNDAGHPRSEVEIRLQWQTIADEFLTAAGHPPTIEQAQQTWCIEMLMRGVTAENLSLLTGWDLPRLQPYLQRAREKAALEQFHRLDQKSNQQFANPTTPSE
ncbi:TetR family transcriptional regulator [Egbenema bharatensis]|uniref:TetR family transcriptional regulator n=1 Tax=Egbenema bharatensis TaxID=3463334 RepID=UPI003A861A18